MYCLASMSSFCLLRVRTYYGKFSINTQAQKYETQSMNNKNLKISKNADTVLNFSYLAIKLPNFKLLDEKLPELEPRVSHSFDIKIVSRKKLLKVLASPQAHFW